MRETHHEQLTLSAFHAPYKTRYRAEPAFERVSVRAHRKPFFGFRRAFFVDEREHDDGHVAGVLRFARRVDARGRQAGVIRGVKVLGLESRNGRTYLPEALAQAAQLYEDAKVNVNHPKGNPAGPRDYQDRIGTIRHVTVHPGEGFSATSTSTPSTPWPSNWRGTPSTRRRTWAFPIMSRRGSAGGASGWLLRRLPACRASTWWPTRPRPAACSSRQPRQPTRTLLQRQRVPRF